MPPLDLTDADGDVLAALAYARVLIRRHAEALTLYRFLARIRQRDPRWAMGESLCLIALRRFGEALDALNRIDIRACPDPMRAALEKMRARIRGAQALPQS